MSALARPENNFDWSSWRNCEVALREIDALIAAVCNGTLPDPKQIALLFAPTGPIQEVSVSGVGERCFSNGPSGLTLRRDRADPGAAWLRAAGRDIECASGFIEILRVEA